MSNNARIREKTAHHEAGHIVLTYLSGYTCESVEFHPEEVGTAATVMNYDDDLLLVTAITNCAEYPYLFNELDRNVKAQSPGVANKVATILLAGPSAEAIYLNGGQLAENFMEVEPTGPDLIRVQNIHYFLSQILPNHEDNFLEDTFRRTLDVLSITEVWNAVEALSSALLQKENKKLTKNEIENILQTVGYLDYIQNLN